jgi:hypothetical protein
MGNALEALRIATTFFVVLYHAALSYLATPMRLTLWGAYDAAGHVTFDYFVYWVNGFAMPVFFLANGVSAPAACEARGPRVFLGSRVRRLLRPLLFGCLTILPFSYLVWGYGLLVTGRIVFDDILRWRFEPEVAHHLYGLGHFWFLQYLFLVCVLWCGGWALRSYLYRDRGSKTAIPAGHRENRWVQRVLSSPWRPVLLAIPTSLIFLVDSDTMLRVDNAVLPNLFRLLHYAYFFTVGGWISRTADPRQRFIPFSTLYLILSFLLFGAMSPLLLHHAAAPLEGWARVFYCLLAALFPWLTVFGGLGVFMRVFQAKGTVMRYLAESSFWLYMAHLPLVALTQDILLPVAWPAPVKFLIVAVVAIGLSLLSYEGIVRRSWIGEIVNGARKRMVKPSRLGPEFGWIATLVVAGVAFAGGAWYFRVFFWGNNLYEVIPGQVFRCARLSGERLDELIRRRGVRTVVTFTVANDPHLWYVTQKRVCQTRRVELQPFSLRDDRIPSQSTLVNLVAILDQCPRPILVEAHRGIDQSGFTTAVAQLLAGVPPSQALRQFDMKYGQFGGPEHSPLGQALLAYRDWLHAHDWPHTAERFRTWADQEYLVHSFPTLPGESRTRGGSVTLWARGLDAALVR